MNWKKLSFYVLHAVHPLLMYGCFVLMTGFIFTQYEQTLEYYDIAARQSVQHLLAIPVLLAFFSTARIFAVYDFVARERYLENGGASFGFFRRLQKTLCSYEFLLSAVVVALLVWALAPGFLYRSLLDPFVDMGSTAAQNRLSRLVFVPLSLLLLLLAQLSARKYWGHVVEKSVLFDLLSAAALLLLAGFAYGLGTIILLLVYPLLKFVVQPSVGIPLLIIILVLTGVFLFFAYGRALLRRRRFVKDLLALCEQEGFDMTPIAHPYRSLFRLAEGPSFTVTAHKKTYTCKLLSCVKRRKVDMHFYQDGACRFVRTIRMSKRKELFRFETDFPFAFDGDGKKLLIVDPMPRMFLVDMGASIPLETGDKVWSYKIFSAEAFLGCLERDCLDR